VTGLIVTVVDDPNGRELANQLASWGYRVLYVGRIGEPWSGHRLATANRFASETATAYWMRPDGFEEIREQWLAGYDVVLIDGTFFGTGPDYPVCYQVPDLVILRCRLDDAGARSAQRMVDRWAYLRDLLPVDRAQLLVVPMLVPGHRVPAGNALSAIGRLCRNWSNREVPIGEVLVQLAGSPASLLAALIAHRCARTDLLISNSAGYIAAAVGKPAFAYPSDVIVVRDPRYQRLGAQLENSLRAAGLRVPELADGTNRAVCVLAGPEDTTEVASYVRRITRWDRPGGPVPLIITALLPGAHPLTLDEPLRSSEWISLEPDRRHVQEAARQVAALLGEGRRRWPLPRFTNRDG
jgi:hypothetical protein